MYIFFIAWQAHIRLWRPLVDVGDPQNQWAKVKNQKLLENVSIDRYVDESFILY